MLLLHNEALNAGGAWSPWLVGTTLVWAIVNINSIVEFRFLAHLRYRS
jgi:hypothetical protein